MITLEDLNNSGVHYIYLKLALGEEEVQSEVLESVYFLLLQFSEDFTDDQD